MKEYIKHSPRAQTMLDASFGPVFLVPIFHRRIVRSFQTYICNKQELVFKKQRIWKKKLPEAQMTHMAFGPIFVIDFTAQGLLWSRFPAFASLSASPCCLPLFGAYFR